MSSPQSGPQHDLERQLAVDDYTLVRWVSLKRIIKTLLRFIPQAGPGLAMKEGPDGLVLRVAPDGAGHPFQLLVGSGIIGFAPGEVTADIIHPDYEGVMCNGVPLSDGSATLSISPGSTYIAYMRVEFVGVTVNLATTGDFWIVDQIQLRSAEIFLTTATDIPEAAPHEIDRDTGDFASRSVDGVSTENGVFFEGVAKFTASTSPSGGAVVTVDKQYMRSNQHLFHRVFSDVLFVPVQGF